MISLRQEFVSSLAQIGFIPFDSTPSTPGLNSCSENTNLVKAVMLGGLWPRVARVHLPKDAIKFDKVSAGTIQRENSAKEFKMYDLREGRVFLHPGSVLFGASAWKVPFLFYFHKHATSKVFLRDASEVTFFLFVCADDKELSLIGLLGSTICFVAIWRASNGKPCHWWFNCR